MNNKIFGISLAILGIAIGFLLMGVFPYNLLVSCPIAYIGGLVAIQEDD